jgi:hypothetical protein
MRRDRERRRHGWVNMSQQQDPEPRFVSRPEWTETPDGVGHGDWDGETGVSGGGFAHEGEQLL